MTGLAWAAALRRAIRPVAQGGMGLSPQVFWALTPVEFIIMAGLEAEPATVPLGRQGLAGLMAAYPDQRGERDGGAG